MKSINDNDFFLTFSNLLEQLFGHSGRDKTEILHSVTKLSITVFFWGFVRITKKKKTNKQIT